MDHPPVTCGLTCGPNRGPSYEPLRRLFAAHGLPGLGPQRRASALAVGLVAQVVDEALHGSFGLPGTTELSGSTKLRHARLLALTLCWHDHWDEAHAVCQAHEGDQDIDLVHMVLHRREPDAANCRYWIVQAGWHPVYNDLPAAATALGLAALASDGRWSPKLFLERCLAASAADEQILIAVQAAELLALRDRLLVGQHG